MERREFIATAGASLVVVAAGPAFAASPSAGDAGLNALMDRLFYAGFELDPESATEAGFDKGSRAGLRSRLNDASLAGEARQVAFDRDALARLQAIAPAGLSDTGRRHRDLAIYLRQQALTPRKFGLSSVQRPFPISQQTGAYFSIPDFLDSRHPIEATSDADAYLARLSGFAKVLDDEAALQKARAARGIIAPPWALDLALGQIRKLREATPEDSPLTQSLTVRAREKGISGDWSARAASVVRTLVYPALDRFAALVDSVKSRSPVGDGIWRVPDGEAIYAAALAEATTTSLSPDEVHRIGLTQVAELTEQLDTVLKAAGYPKGSLGARLSALNTASDQLYPNTDAGRAAMIADLNRGVAAMRERLPQAFNDVPNDPLDIRRVPPEIQDGAPNGYYYRAPKDGSRPAIYWINLKDTADWPRYQLPDLTYHEGLPGHHLQLSYVRHAGDLPLLLSNVFISAYGEGWALYAEQLAAELGMMEGLVRAGYLQSLLFRSARLVVDTGIHHKRWSREQATRAT